LGKSPLFVKTKHYPKSTNIFDLDNDNYEYVIVDPSSKKDDSFSYPKKILSSENSILNILFEDGEIRKYDVSLKIKSKNYKRLSDPSFFKKASIDGGFIVWDDLIDISPEDSYYNSVPIAKV
jgi:hypothetical protein